MSYETISTLIASLLANGGVHGGLKAQERRIKELLGRHFTEAFAVNELPRLQKMDFQRGVRRWLATGMPDRGIPELEIPMGTYVYQPLGTQGFPDFLVRDHAGRYFIIEGKFTFHDHIVWNEGYPRPNRNALYVFSTPEETTVYCGADLMTSHMVRAIQEAKDGCDRMCEQQALLIRDADQANLNFRCDNRIQVFSRNPLYHPDRQKFEMRVIRFAHGLPEMLSE